VALLASLPPETPVYRWFFRYWRSDDFFQLGFDWNAGRLLRLYALLPLALHGVATVLMGLSFGALQRAVQDDPASSGRKVGFLQAANIAGCTAGSLLTGLVLLGRLGSGGALRLLLVTLGLVFLGLRARAGGFSRGLVAWTLALLAVAAALPSSFELWKRLHGVTVSEPPSFIGEDASAVSVIVPGDAGRWRITVNGLPHSWLPYEGIHTLLGALPALIHPEPREIVVVGLGSGETAWAAGCRPETRSLQVYEIAASQPRLLREVSAVALSPRCCSCSGIRACGSRRRMDARRWPAPARCTTWCRWTRSIAPARVRATSTRSSSSACARGGSSPVVSSARRSRAGGWA